ncbi:MAG TPA: hypothetical protein PLR35_17245 [Burkholderiaceae bacterium]|nr:hypothetical protein [Burkholderiaceae bacterium]
MNCTFHGGDVAREATLRTALSGASRPPPEGIGACVFDTAGAEAPCPMTRTSVIENPGAFGMLRLNSASPRADAFSTTVRRTCSPLKTAPKSTSNAVRSNLGASLFPGAMATAAAVEADPEGTRTGTPPGGAEPFSEPPAAVTGVGLPFATAVLPPSADVVGAVATDTAGTVAAGSDCAAGAANADDGARAEGTGANGCDGAGGAANADGAVATGAPQFGAAVRAAGG